MADIYGSDISTFAGEGGACDTDPLMPRITGPRVVLEAVARRFMSRGLPHAEDFGFDLRSLIAKRITPLEAARLQKTIQAEARKDERVEDATVTLTAAATSVTIHITLTLATGKFPLVLSVDSVSTAVIFPQAA